MNFLKISSLVIGTGSVVGGTGAGIYYGVIKSSETTNDTNDKNNSDSKKNEKVSFVGKLVFEKKTDGNYIIKFLNNEQYYAIENSFNSGKTDENQEYAAVNEVIEISRLLNIENTKTELGNIFGNEITLTNAKAKITSEATKLKELLGTAIYTKLQAIN